MAKTLIEYVASKITGQAKPPQKAAAAGGMYQSANNGGANMIGTYYSYVEGDARNKAMSVPTISRARDLMASVHRLHGSENVQRNLERRRNGKNAVSATHLATQN
jgi:hypothetical protein